MAPSDDAGARGAGKGLLDKSSTSQLVLLGDAEYEAGIARIRAAADAARERGEVLVLRSELRLWATTGHARVAAART